MITTARDWCDRLNISYHEAIEPYYERGVALFTEKGDFAFNTERLKRLNDKYNFMRKYFDDVLECAEMLKGDEDLALFVYVLVALYEQNYTQYIKIDGENVKVLEAPERERLDTDMTPIFSSFYFLERMIGEMEGRGVPHNIISDSLNGMDVEINDYVGIYARPGMKRYISWYLNWVRCLLYKIGRFQFKPAPYNGSVRVYRKGDEVAMLIDNRMMHKKGMCFGSAGQTDEEGKYYAEIVEEDGAFIGYSVNEFGEGTGEKVRLEGYTEVMRKGDMIIEVHIPAKDPMTPDICDASYKEAIDFFKKCYPEYDFKAITCQSWMLDKRIPQLLGKETNLTRFMDKYTGYPLISSGQGLYAFVFNLHSPVPAEELPEDTSLRRVIKQHLMNGGYIYEKGGFMLI